ncbi:MAG: hypothetical protein ABUT20_18535 [Bacteroidota bacterium]
MKRNLVIFFFLLFSACNSNDKKTATIAENDIDAAREFIRSALDGKFETARIYLLDDSSNIQYITVAERNYQKADAETKYGYRNASIRIYSPVTYINDSTSIIVYSNSYKNDPDTLKVLKKNGQWLVDLKYLYEHDSDSIQINKSNIDSLK